MRKVSPCGWTTRNAARNKHDSTRGRIDQLLGDGDQRAGRPVSAEQLARSVSAFEQQQQPIDPASLAALTLQSVAGDGGGPSVQTLQALPKIPTPIEAVSRANANAAQLQSVLNAAGNKHTRR